MPESRLTLHHSEVVVASIPRGRHAGQAPDARRRLQGGRIAWVLDRENPLVELLERSAPTSPYLLSIFPGRRFLQMVTLRYGKL